MKILPREAMDFKQDLKDLKFWPLLVVRFLVLMLKGQAYNKIQWFTHYHPP